MDRGHTNLFPTISHLPRANNSWTSFLIPICACQTLLCQVPWWRDLLQFIENLGKMPWFSQYWQTTFFVVPEMLIRHMLEWFVKHLQNLVLDSMAYLLRQHWLWQWRRHLTWSHTFEIVLKIWKEIVKILKAGGVLTSAKLCNHLTKLRA